MEKSLITIDTPKPIVKYDRKFCAFIGYNGLSKFDQDFFYAVLSILKEEKKTYLVISLPELVKRAEYDNKTKTQHRMTITNLCQKLVVWATRVMACNLVLKDDHSTEILALFDKFKIDAESEELTVSLGASFSHFFSGIEGNKFTRFYLEKFLRFKSKYSQSLYRLLLDHYSDFTMPIDELYLTLQLKKKNAQNQFIHRLPKYIEEVQATGDFVDDPPISYVLHKNRRKITAISFVYQEKRNRMQMQSVSSGKKNNLPQCPYCGQKLHWTTNTNTGEKFIGHVDWKNCTCEVKTYDSLDMLEETISKVNRLAEKEKEKAEAKAKENKEMAALQKKVDEDPNWSPFPADFPTKDKAAESLPDIKDVLPK